MLAGPDKPACIQRVYGRAPGALIEAPKTKTVLFLLICLTGHATTSQVALSKLRRHAKEIGVNEADLARDLLEVIAQDDLYYAVLDRAKLSEQRRTNRTNGV